MIILPSNFPLMGLSFGFLTYILQRSCLAHSIPGPCIKGRSWLLPKSTQITHPGYAESEQCQYRHTNRKILEKLTKQETENIDYKQPDKV